MLTGMESSEQMDELEKIVVHIAADGDKKLAKDTLSLLVKIFLNIVNHPDNAAFRRIAADNEMFAKADKQYKDFYRIFVLFNFRKHVIEFKEKWILERVSAIDIAKMSDFLSILEEYRDKIRLPEQDALYKKLQASKKEHRDHVDEILKSAEQDRVEVKERNRREIERLRRRQNR